MAAPSEEQIKMPNDPTSSDAEWKKIQQNTFTRWCNEHLKCVNLFIYSLELDLCDGLKLISLLQVLAHKKIARYNKKPNFKSQKLENLSIALKFIEDENIKLVNIDASDIAKGNLKLILGLIWTLILKYQISIPMMDDDDEAEQVSPKQGLLNWARSKLPQEVQVNNFNSDWNNGIVLASLVESSAPGLFPDWEDLDPKNALENATQAMKLAEDWLGVPQVITPSEITNPKVDDLSVMTYVSYFPESKLKPGAPLKPKMNAASKSKAYGPGLEPEGVVVNMPADFTIVTPGSSTGKMDVRVYGPGRKLIDCSIKDNHDHTYSCQYSPPKQGIYDVHIRIGSHHIPNSPFRVRVSSGLDASKVIAKGYGLQAEGVVVKRPAPFQIIAKGSDREDLTIEVIDPRGGKKTEIKIEDRGDGEYHCQYMPMSVGKHVIKIKIDGAEVARSPYHINVSYAATLVKMYGPGLESGLKTGKATHFTVDTNEAGAGDLKVSIEGPGKGTIDCDTKDNGDGTYTCTYKPLKAGTYIVKITYDQIDVPRSPLKVVISASADLSKIKAYGPGLEKGVAGLPAEFFVEAKNASIASLTFAVEGPGEAKVEVTDRGDQTCAVKYFPTAPGEYTVHVMYDEVDIPSGPFRVKVGAPGDAGKVYAEGPGLKPGCMTGRPAEFTVFTKKAGGAGVVDVTCVDEAGNPVEVKVKENAREQSYSVCYMPINPGTYTVTIRFSGKDIPDSPIKVPIKPFCDSTLVKADGPGLKSGKANKPANFKIDASKAGEGGIGLTVEGPCESEIKCDDHGDGTCDVTYLPVEDGDYNINITFADQPIPGSPFKAVISSDFDATKVKVSGPGIKAGCKAGKPCDIDIDATKAGKAKLLVEVTDEVGAPVKIELDEEEPGLFGCTYFPKTPGKYTANVSYGGKPVPRSPFSVVVDSSSDPSKVKVSGPGIEPKGVKSFEPTQFEVDASKAGEGSLDVNIEPKGRDMPKVSEIEVKEGKKPNTYVVSYVPPKHGKYEIGVKFDGQAVPKSPFPVEVSQGVDVSKCKASGPGIEEPIIGQECPINVECAPDAGDAVLTAVVESPSKKTDKVKVTDNGDLTYDIGWTPKETGKHKITIKYGEREIPGSPYFVNVVPKGEASKVKAYGPGLEKATVHKPADFTIETKEAGAGSLGLSIEGPSEAEITCKDNGDGTCAVRYTPVESGDYDINVRFADDHIPGSPFSVKASHPVDASKVRCSGPGVEKELPAGAPTEFLVDCKKAGDAPLEVEITGPDRKKCTPKIKDNNDDTYTVSYQPGFKGRHTIGVKYAGEAVPQSPFRVNAQPQGDASKCKVFGPITRPNVGFPSEFGVDTKEAGPGHLTVIPRNAADEELPMTCEDVGEGVFACAYTPEELGPHNVDVLFGGNPVPGSPFQAKAEKAPKVDKIHVPEEMFAAPSVDQPLECLVDTTKSAPRDLPKDGVVTATITTPSGKKEPADVKDNKDGTFQLNYVPCEVGVYRLDIKYDSVPVPGSPFTFEVTEGGPDKVKVYGKGLRQGVAGRPATFTVETKNAGPGGLSVSVEGPSESEIKCTDHGDGTVGVSYVPLDPGNYDVHVKFADQAVPGSPFKPHVVSEEPIFEVEHPCDFEMAPTDFASKDVPSLQGVLTAPSGKKEPVKITEGPNDSFIATFTPKEYGKNMLDITKRGKHIKDSPFPIYVRDKPVLGQPCHVPFECADVERPADVPKLKGTVVRPNGKEEPLDVELDKDGEIAVAFVPKDVGKHIINITKNGKHVEDSPYIVMVEATPGEVPVAGKPCDVNLDIPGVKLPDDLKRLTAKVKRPNGRVDPIECKMSPEKTLALSFVPYEAGEHLISVKKDKKHVPNSPFSIFVVDAPKVGSEVSNKFDVPGLQLPEDLKDLKAVLTTPSGNKKPINVSEGPNETLAIDFVPEEPGKHIIDVTKNGKPVKGSPFEVIVEESVPMEGAPIVGDECPMNFEVPDVELPKDLKDLKAVLSRPSGKKEPIDVAEGPDGTLALAFTPDEPGKHLIDVTKKGKPVDGSPFEVMVDETAPTEGGPVVGKECALGLDIPGLDLPKDLKNLEGELERPTGKKSPLDIGVGPDGKTLSVNFVPTEKGKHLVHITKFKKPVAGSPFVVMVGEEKPKGPTVGNPCDVNLAIPGVELPRDLRKLKGQLTRPTGKKEPLDLKSTPENTLNVSFVPNEPGEHLIDVTKDSRPVEGSPFSVIVEDAIQEEKVPRVNSECDVNLDIPELNLPEDLKHVTGELERPNGKKEPLDVKCNPDNTLGVAFVPKEPGKHLIHVKKRGRPVSGSPYEVMVAPEKHSPSVGSPCDVGFDIPGLDLPKDLKYLDGIVERPNGDKEPVDLKATDDGKLAVSFTPKQPGKHLIHINKNKKPIDGSPFEVMVAPASGGIPVGRPCDVGLDIPGLNLPRDLKYLDGELERPTGKKEPLELKSTDDGKLAVAFTPKEVGKHLIHVSKNKRPVDGSPFEVMVGPQPIDEDLIDAMSAPTDESQPGVGRPCDAGLDIPGLDLPRDLKFLTGEVERPTGKKDPVDLKATDDGKLAVAFTPKEPGNHLIHIKKNNRPVTGSPFEIMVAPQGPAVGKPCDVGLDIPGLNLPKDLKYLDGELERPNGKKEPLDLKATDDGKLAVSFTPKQPGKHLVHIKKDRKPIDGSPFVVMVAPESSGLPVGRPCDVGLDIPGLNLPRDLKYLDGELERPTGKKEPLDLKSTDDGKLAVAFTPKEVGKHLIHIKKNSRPIDGSPFEVMVGPQPIDEDLIDAMSVPTDESQPGVGRPCDAGLDIPGIDLPRDLKYMDGELERPNGKKEPLDLKATDDGKLAVSFTPKEPGKHLLHIKKNNKPVTGSPFEVMVAPQGGPAVGRPCDVGFNIPELNLPRDLKFLKGTLERPNGEKEPIELKATDDGKLNATFTPKQTGKHLIHIEKNGRPIASSPIEVMVGDAAKPKSCDVGLEIPGIKIPDDIRFLTGTIKSPSGKEKPVELLPGKDNKSLLVSFIPEEVGTHKLSIKKNSRHIGDSPYDIVVKQEDIQSTKPDATKVKAYGKGLHEGQVNRKSTFDVDTKNAGYGGLGLSIEGPSKVELNCVDNEDGTCTVDYCPKVPGSYTMNVTFADDHVPGSPFNCKVKDSDGVVPVEEDMLCATNQRGVETAPQDSYSDILAFPSSQGQQPQQDFVIKFDGAKDLKATITRPSGAEDDAEIVETGNDTFTVRFVPKERGEHLVNVKSKRRHIPGSPFKVLVEAPAGGAKACRAEGPGLEQGIAHQPAQFKVITRDAGPGGLAVAVEGPAKAEIQCHDNGDGSCDIAWYPVEPGEYTVHIRFADEAIPDSPFNVRVLPQDESSAMSMAQFQEQILRVGQQASFAVQMKGKEGDITASVISPSGQELDCAVRELEEKGNFAVRFVPKELGVHHVNVFFNGTHIPGSPFTVKVGGLEGDPSKVKAFGPGLNVAVVEKSAEFTVNALEAGSGALALSIDGPAKVKMNCVEQDDGTYLVTYKPTISGSYEITIKFAGQHITSSPFKIMVFRSEDEVDASYLPGDASKCTTRGSGLRRAYLGKQAEFTVNASNAGRGSIMVGVEGPMVPAKEICVIHTGNNIYTVHYILEEAGDYILKILWGDNHIPGSPCHVTV